MKLRRLVLLLVLAAGVLLLRLFWPVIREPRGHMDDRIGLIPEADELEFNRYLDRVQTESGIDIRIVLAPDSRGSTPEQFALATRAIEALPDTLRKYGAPFPTVQLYRWRSGMLDATMDELGIRVGMSWQPPLVAVLDREGEVVWQAQGVTDWAAVEKTALTVGQER